MSLLFIGTPRLKSPNAQKVPWKHLGIENDLDHHDLVEEITEMNGEFLCLQIVVLNGKEMGGTVCCNGEDLEQRGRWTVQLWKWKNLLGVSSKCLMTGPQHKVAQGSVGVLKIIISHSLEKMCFVCEAIFSTSKLIVASVPYFQVLLWSNNRTNPNKTTGIAGQVWSFCQTWQDSCWRSGIWCLDQK